MPGQTYDFNIGETAFKQGTLPPLVAIGIAAKFGTILKHAPAMIRTVNQMREQVAQARERGEPADFVGIALQSDVSVLGPLGQAIADIPDEHRDRIIEQILRVTLWQNQPGAPGFMPTWDPMARAPVDGIDTVMVLRILYETYRVQLAPFMPAPASDTSGPAGGATYEPVTLYDDLDFVMDPVLAGMCHFESVKDGTVSLMDLALMNDALEARRENERRARRAVETK